MKSVYVLKFELMQYYTITFVKHVWRIEGKICFQICSEQFGGFNVASNL